MAVHPNTPNLANGNNNNNVNHFQPLPRPPLPRNGIMAAPNFNRPGGFGAGAFARNLGAVPRQMYIPPHHQAQHHAPRPAANFDFDEEDEERDDIGPILIRVNCPVVIKGDNNVCSIDPATLTQRITMAIANSLRTMGNGVPMINENGDPREIRVDVTAETRIEGNRNFVGEKYAGMVIKAEEDKAVANGNAPGNAIENGSSSGGKRKITQVDREEQDVASAGLRIKLEPNGSQEEDEDEHSVKRPRHA